MNLGVTGKKGEDMVASFLRKKGYSILKRNYRCRYGEIDIISQKENIIAFTEVKTRHEKSLVSPKEAVTGKKMTRITSTAQDYLTKTRSSDHIQPRFDVAEVTLFNKKDSTTGYKLNYIKNAF